MVNLTVAGAWKSLVEWITDKQNAVIALLAVVAMLLLTSLILQVVICSYLVAVSSKLTGPSDKSIPVQVEGEVIIGNKAGRGGFRIPRGRYEGAVPVYVVNPVDVDVQNTVDVDFQNTRLNVRLAR